MHLVLTKYTVKLLVELFFPVLLLYQDDISYVLLILAVSFSKNSAII